MTVQPHPHHGHFLNRLRATDTDYATDARVKGIDPNAFTGDIYKPHAQHLLALPPVDPDTPRRVQTLRDLHAIRKDFMRGVDLDLGSDVRAKEDQSDAISRRVAEDRWLVELEERFGESGDSSGVVKLPPLAMDGAMDGAPGEGTGFPPEESLASTEAAVLVETGSFVEEPGVRRDLLAEEPQKKSAERFYSPPKKGPAALQPKKPKWGTRERVPLAVAVAKLDCPGSEGIIRRMVKERETEKQYRSPCPQNAYIVKDRGNEQDQVAAAAKAAALKKSSKQQDPRGVVSMSGSVHYLRKEDLSRIDQEVNQIAGEIMHRSLARLARANEEHEMRYFTSTAEFLETGMPPVPAHAPDEFHEGGAPPRSWEEGGEEWTQKPTEWKWDPGALTQDPYLVYLMSDANYGGARVSKVTGQPSGRPSARLSSVPGAGGKAASPLPVGAHADRKKVGNGMRLAQY